MKWGHFSLTLCPGRLLFYKIPSLWSSSSWVFCFRSPLDPIFQDVHPSIAPLLFSPLQTDSRWENQAYWALLSVIQSHSTVQGSLTWRRPLTSTRKKVSLQLSFSRASYLWPELLNEWSDRSPRIVRVKHEAKTKITSFLCSDSKVLIIVGQKKSNLSHSISPATDTSLPGRTL